MKPLSAVTTCIATIAMSGGILLAGPTLPTYAASDEIERELERMGLPREYRSGIPAEMRTPPNAREPGLTAALTFAAPITLASFGFSLGNDAIPLTLVLTPLSVGLGHVYAGDPKRGAWVALGVPVAIFGSYALGNQIGLAVIPETGRGFSDMRGIGVAVLGAAIATAAYWGWAAYDAYETANRTSEDARKQQGKQPAER